MLIPDRHCYLWENPGGQVDGYLIYEIFDQSLPRVRSFGAEVKEIITLNHEARRSIFAFIKRLPPQIKKTVFRMPLPDLCHSYFLNPRPDVRLIPGFMARIIDVRRVFEMKKYSPDLSGKVVFGVKDQIAEWNQGSFSLEVENGRAHVRNYQQSPLHVRHKYPIINLLWSS